MGKPAINWAVKGIFPCGWVVTLKHGASHRQMHNWIHDKGGTLRNKYKMVMFVSSITQPKGE